MSKKIKLYLLCLSSFILTIYTTFPTNNELQFIEYFKGLSEVILMFIILSDCSCKPLNWKTICLFTVLLLYTIIRYDTYFMHILLFAMAFRDVSLYDFFSKDLIFRMLIFSIAGILYLNGKIGDISSVTKIGELSLWYFHHNTLGIVTTIMGLELLYVCRKKTRFLAYLICIVILFFNYKIFNSRASFIALLITLVLFVIYRIFNKIFTNVVSRFILRNSFIFLLAISFILVYIYANNLEYGETLNNLFSSRLYLSQYYLDLYGTSAFGKPIISGAYTIYIDGVMYYTLDMGYVMSIVKYGFIGTFLIFILYNRTIKKLEEQNKYELILAITGMLIHGLMEIHMFDYTINIFIPAFSLGLFYFENKNENSSSLCLSVFFSLMFTLLYGIRNIGDTVYSSNSIQTLSAFVERFNSGTLTSLYDWSLGLGSNIFNAFSSNYFSIFNFLAIPFGLDNIQLAFIFICAIKFSLLGLFVYLWLSNLTKDKKIASLLSICLTLSGLFISNYNSSLIDMLIFLSALLFFIERNNYVGIVVSSLLTFLYGYNYTIHLLIFLTIYICSKWFINKKIRPVPIILIYLSSICIFMLLLPYKEYMITNCFNVANSNIVNYIKTFLCSFLSLPNSGLKMYLACSGVASIFIILLIKDNKKKIIYSSMLLIAFLSSFFLSNISDETAFFIFVFYFYFLIATLSNMDIAKNSSILIYRICLSLITIAYVALFFRWYVSSNAVSDSMYIYGSAIVLILIFSIFALRRLNFKTIAMIMVFELTIGTMGFVEEKINTSSKLVTNSNISSEIIQKLKETDSGLYRVIDAEYDISFDKLNSSYYGYSFAKNNFANQIAGFSIDSSLYNDNQANYLTNTLSSYYNDYFGYTKNLLSYYNLAGAKYIYNDNHIKQTYYEMTITEDNVDKLEDGIYIIKYSNDENYSLGLNDEGFGVQETNYSLSQIWKIEHDDNGYVSLINLKDNDIYDFSSTIGDTIRFYPLETVNSSKIPTYYEKIEDLNCYKNKYFIELGYVNNNVINSDYLSTLDDFTKELVLREYIAINDTENSTFSLNWQPSLLNDFHNGDDDYTYIFDSSINNANLIIDNIDDTPYIKVELYNDDQLVKEERFYDHDYCSINIDETEFIDKIHITYEGVDNSPTFNLYYIDTDETMQKTLYEERNKNSFTNVSFKNDYIDADITINEDNSLVYTYIPYDDNWKVLVDGQEINKLSANYGFIAFRLNEGVHHVEFIYSINYPTVYLIISIVTFVLMISILIFTKFKKTYKQSIFKQAKF